MFDGLEPGLVLGLALLLAGGVRRFAADGDPGAARGWEVVSATREQGGTAVRVVTRSGRVTVTHIRERQTGFEGVQISQDRRSVWWSAREPVGTSYSIDADFEVFRDGKKMPGIDMEACGEGGGVVTGFDFWAGGVRRSCWTPVIRMGCPGGISSFTRWRRGGAWGA